MSGKFIITATGPAMKYRLDILKRSSPDILKDYVIIFTDVYSYNLYTDHHKNFNFVIIDDIRKNYPISLKYEKIMEVSTEEEFFEQMPIFYNGVNKQLYPYDIHRFIMPYCVENNILNFALIDSDMILNNDCNVIERYFEEIPDATLNMHWFGEDGDQRIGRDNFLMSKIQPLFPQIDFKSKIKRNCDGYIRGFKFKNKEDLTLFFNIWNKSLECLFESIDYSHLIGGYMIMDSGWLCPYIMQIFQNLHYSFVDCHEVLHVKSLYGIRAYRHYSRPEDTLYYKGYRGAWDVHNFDYNNVTNIASFVKQNKVQLQEYYECCVDIMEITDSHVYTKLLL